MLTMKHFSFERYKEKSVREEIGGFFPSQFDHL